MPKIANCLTSRSEIIKLSLLPNGSIIYATKQHGIRAFNPKTCETNLHLNPKQLTDKTSTIAFSQDGNYIAIANKQTITIIYIPTRKIIKTIKTDEKDITLISFDPQTNYIITATKNGRVLQYKFTHSSLLSRIFSLKPPINTVTFHNNLIASAGNGDEILINSLNSLSKSIIIKNNGVTTTSLKFLTQDKIISGNKDGIIFIHSIKKPTEYIRIDSGLRIIKNIIIMPDSRYIMVSGIEKKLVVIDIEKEKIIHHNYIDFNSQILNIIITDDEQLIVALKNNNILKIELPSRKKVLALLEENRLVEAYQLVDREPMIKGSKEHKKLETKYQAIISQAVIALSNNNKELALQLTTPFKQLTSKSIEISELFRAFEKFTRFQALFLEKKYALAYAMTTKYPVFKYTLQYKKMEKSWQDTFADAQRQMILGQDDIAKGILSHYMTTITKRSLIKFVLNHNKEFLEFLKAIEKKEYKKVYTFIRKNTLFKQVPTFNKMEEEIQSKLLLAKEYIYKSDINKALDAINNFENIPHLYDEIKELTLKCKYLKELQKEYQDNNFIRCYELIDTHKELEDIELTNLLENHWTKLMAKCEDYSLTGDLKKVKKTLKDLIYLPTRRKKIGNLLRVSYQSKIKILLSTKGFRKAEAVIYAYLDIFGLDREINILKEYFEKLAHFKLALEDNETLHRSRDYWINTKVVK